MHPRWKNRALAALLGLVGLYGTDCMGPVVPIPPPGVDAVLAERCPAAVCTGGGVIVRVRGVARPGALVMVENLSRTLESGARYVASGYTEPEGPAPGDGGVPGTTSARYEVVLGPALGTDGTARTVSQGGDRIVVYQYARNERGVLELSQTSDELVVPR